MFVVSRDVLESLIIDDQIEVTVLAIHGGRVQIGITAPPSVRIFRSELEAQTALSARKAPSVASAVDGERVPFPTVGMELEVNPLTGSTWVKPSAT